VVRQDLFHQSLLDVPPSFNTDDVMPHVRSIVQKVYDSHLPESFEALGINVYFGTPQFLDNHRIKVGEKILSGDKLSLQLVQVPLSLP